MSGAPPLFVALGEIELHLPGARSLKEKRHDVRSLVERLRHRFSVLVIEADHQELHQRSALAVTALATDGGVARSIVDRALDHAEQTFTGVVLGRDVSVHQIR